jgi:hypothetical protein
MSEIKSYRNLTVWQKSVALVTDAYRQAPLSILLTPSALRPSPDKDAER